MKRISKYKRTDFVLWLLPAYIVVAYWRVFLVILSLLAGVAACCGQSYSGQVIYGGLFNAGANVTLNDCVLIPARGQWAIYSDIPGATIWLSNCYILGKGLKTWRASSVTVKGCHFECRGHNGLVIQDNGPTQQYVSVTNTDIADALTAIALQGVQCDPNVWLVNNRITQTIAYKHNDQVSIYQSSGTRAHRIELNHLLLVCNPDSPQTMFSGGIIVDAGSGYTAVINCTVLNGQSNSGIASYANGTSIFTANAIVGIGARSGWSVGLSVAEGAGRAYNNMIGWWDSFDGILNNLYTPLDGSNWLLTSSQITLALEERLIEQWQKNAGSIGCHGQPQIQLPASGFPQ